jgi:hypothetical protein
MAIRIASPKSPAPYFNKPQSPYLYRPAGPPVLSGHVLVRALQTIPIGLWVSADLNGLPGSTPKGRNSRWVARPRNSSAPSKRKSRGARCSSGVSPSRHLATYPSELAGISTGRRWPRPVSRVSWPNLRAWVLGYAPFLPISNNSGDSPMTMSCLRLRGPGLIAAAEVKGQTRRLFCDCNVARSTTT